MNTNFWKTLGLILCLTLPCVAETITGNRTISTDYAPSDNFMIVGTTTTPGNVQVTSGTTTLSGGTPVDFRSKNAGLLIVNGTVTVSNASVKATTNGVYANAAAGNSASLIINNGGYVYSAGYPGMGADHLTTGSLIVNSGGTFESPNSFYCGGHGIGTVRLNDGGALTITNSKGLQIGRDYESVGGTGYGDCEGYFYMTGGTLTTAAYLIIGRNNPETNHVNVGVYDMSGGTANIGSYFSVGNCNTSSTKDPDYIRCTANISGNSVVNISGTLNVGNGEGNNALNGTPTPSTLNLRDTASVTVAEGVSSGKFLGIGSKATVNLYGGTLTNYAANGMQNGGTLNLLGGELVSGDTATKLLNSGTLNAKAGTITSAVALTNTGTANFNGTGVTLNAVFQNNATAHIISGDNVFNECVVIGDTTTLGELNITGGNTTINGEQAGTFRDDTPGLRITNGKVTITNATLTTKPAGSGTNGSAIFVDAPAGCIAELVIGKGAVVTSNSSHPSAGAEAGTTGTITIDGGQFTTNESMYIGGNGVGYLNVKSGSLQVKGLQVARDYQNATNPASGNCEGYVNLTGGEVKATSYFIISHDNKAGSTHPTYVEFNMSGDAKASSGTYFCLADNASSFDDKSMVQANANFRDQSTLTVGTNLSIGSGENAVNLLAKGGTATFNVYDEAVITAGRYTSINTASSLNMYGGELQANGVGTTGGQDTSKISLDNAGKIQMAGGSITTAQNLNNSGTLQFSNGLKGFGNITVGGDMNNTGTIRIATGSGIGLISGYDAANGTTLMNATGTMTSGNVVTDSTIGSVSFSDGKMQVKLAGAAAGTLNAVSGELTLTTPSQSGWVNLTGFTGNDPFEVRLLFDGITDATKQGAIQSQLESDLTLGDEAYVEVERGEAFNELVLSGLTSDILTANALSWNFLADAYQGVALTGIAMQQVPEPSALLLLLGMLLGLTGLRKRK